MDDYFFNSKEFKNNLSLYEHSLKEGKVCILSSDELIDIAEYYNTSGMFEEAMEAAKYASKLYPEASMPLIFMAKMNICIYKDANNARKQLQRVYDIEYVDYYTTYAESFLFEDNLNEALKWLTKGTTTFVGKDLQDLYIDAAFLLMDYKQIDEAKKWANKISDKLSDDFIKLTARFCMEDRNFKEAIRILENMIDKDPFSYDYWLMLANVQLSNEMYSDALSSCEYAIAINPKINEAYLYQGNAFLKLCNYEKALEAYRIYTDGYNSDMGNMLQGRCMFYMQKNDEAIMLFKKAERLCPNDKNRITDIYKDLAIVYSWNGEYDKANFYINKIKDIGCVDSELYIIEGGLLLTMNKFEEATRTFLCGYSIADSQQTYILQIAISYYEHRYDSAAYKMLKELQQINPKNIQGIAYLTACCFYLGKIDEFIENLEIAIQKRPDEARIMLADIFPKELEIYDYLKYAKDRFKENE